jgi:hypothetical protein
LRLFITVKQIFDECYAQHECSINESLYFCELGLDLNFFWFISGCLWQNYADTRKSGTRRIITRCLLLWVVAGIRLSRIFCLRFRLIGLLTGIRRQLRSCGISWLIFVSLGG